VRRRGRLNTCAGCLPKVTGVQRLPTVLAARQKLPPETAAEGKLLTKVIHLGANRFLKYDLLYSVNSNVFSIGRTV